MKNTFLYNFLPFYRYPCLIKREKNKIFSKKCGMVVNNML